MRETNEIKSIIKTTLMDCANTLIPWDYSDILVRDFVKEVGEELTSLYKEEIVKILNKHIEKNNDFIQCRSELITVLDNNPILVSLSRDVIGHIKVKNGGQFCRDSNALRDKANRLYKDTVLTLPFIKNRKELDKLLKEKIEELNNFYAVFIINSGKTHEV